ncbi:hypothetical protein C2E21_3250 [Chlorella sorokiniana]|uniref:Uncharacterized protein n=1 Tax=Chlorella sorokiniana TaxID=3076 RepID=A0A2P6TX52_CHLSO|nr:hypothetical protein C2E21_3250 [Chlorella sorokiniana]|eukprot:PRW58643.1 hypothetical protein C2E21_3250 [Chlorella sorokiniana]
MATAASKQAAQAAAEEPEFDPTLDSWQVNYARLLSHVMQKGFQVGGLVGCLVVAPIVFYRARQGGTTAAVPKAVNAVFKTVMASTAASTAMAVARMASIDNMKEGLEDRAYRLHYNQGQVRTDHFAQIGTLVGGTAAVALLPASAAAVVAGGAAGAAVGVLAHVATAPKPEE